MSMGSTGEQLTKIRWYPSAPPSTQELLGNEGVNLALGFVTFCYGQKSV